MEIINFIHIPKNGGTSMKQLCYKNFILKCNDRNLNLYNKNFFLKYNGHGSNVNDKNLKNQLVILRDPIDRFISCVYYALQKWSHTPHINYLISKGIDTPDKWVQIWSNPSHEEHKHLMIELSNVKNTKIGNITPNYNWIYCPQFCWINNPRFIIIMDNLDDEIEYFKNKYNIKGDIIHTNKSNHVDSYLSEKSKDFLMNFYKKDYEIYKKYKNMSKEERI